MKETVIFIGSNKSGTSREALIAAGQMGFYTVLLTDRKSFLKKRTDFPEVNEIIFSEILRDKNYIFQVKERLEDEGKRVLAVTSFIDPFVSFAASISVELGLAEISATSLALMEDKTGVRRKLKHLPFSPNYAIIRLTDTIAEHAAKFQQYLPLVIKSPMSNGSKDVLFAETIEQLEASFELFHKKYPDRSVLIEEYIAGPQFLIEVLVHKGEIMIAAIIEQEVQKEDRFIITGYIYPAVITEEDMETLRSAVTSIIHQLGLTNGNCHLELRRAGDEWKVIEINPRMAGGAMNRIIYEGTGIYLVKEILKQQMGAPPELARTKEMHVYAKFITVGEMGKLLKVTGKNRAISYEGVREVYIKPKKGTILTRPFSLGDRYAYVLAAAETAAEAKEIASHAAGEIKFYLEPL